MSTATLSTATLSTATLSAATSGCAPSPAVPAPAPSLDDLRGRIDALDVEILRLVRERSQISARIGAVRRAAGGPRIVHARENEVVGRWRAALGRPGATIALALLELGRGPA